MNGRPLQIETATRGISLPWRFPRDVRWLFLVPALALYGFIIVYPMLAGVGFAFTNWNGLDPHYTFVGLDNFRRLLNDKVAISSISTTLIVAAILVVLKNVVGLALALVLDMKLKTVGLLRFIFFMPVVMTPVIIAFVWRYILSDDGPLDLILLNLGLADLKQSWLGDPGWALVSVIGVGFWQAVGISMVIYLAGLQAVPKEIIEAAWIDGGNAWQRFRYVVFPMLAPAVTISVVMTTIQSLKIFDQIYVLTQGGPGYATEVLSTVIYKTSFQFAEFGYGTSMALVFAILVGAIVLVATHVLRKNEFNHG